MNSVPRTKIASKSRNSIEVGRVRIPGRTVERAVVVIETATVLTAEPLGVIDDGVILQVASMGTLPQVNEIAWSKPPSGRMVTVKFADWPALTVADAGDAEREKSMPVPDKVTVWGLPVELSAMDRIPVRLPPAEGLNVTLMEQLAPEPRLAPQLLV